MDSQASNSTTAEGQSEGLKFTLQVVSPSVGVSSPLVFSNLLAATTVKQLKAKIRDTLPSRPADEGQRLIHHGRMLARDAETMLEIFGQEALASADVRTLHLVLRPPETVTTQIPAVPATLLPQPTMPAALPPQFPPRPQSTPVNPIQAMHQNLHQHGMHPRQPVPAFQHTDQHQLLHHVEHVQNIMGQRLQQLQRETQRLHHEMTVLEQQRIQHLNPSGTMPHNQTPNNLGAGQTPPAPAPVTPQPPGPQTVQMLINQQQRERAAERLRGVQLNNAHGPSGPASGRASPNLQRPDHTTTYTREGVGPNGERWQMTVNETTTTIPLPQPHPLHHHPGQQPNPALELQALLRNADRFTHNNLQRSASNPPLGRAASATGITRPGTPSMVTSTTNNGFTMPPNLFNPSANNQISLNSSHAHASGVPPNSQPTSEPMVYILSSPSGPQALLVSNTDTFYTPRQSSRRHHTQHIAAQGVQPVGLPEFRNRQAHREARRNRQQANQQGIDPLVPAPHANPGAGAMAAQAGPLLWLIVRLVGFVWFFTAGNPSWTRWLMVSGLAFLVFIVNTGILNGTTEQILGPIRRHLENLIPLAGPDAALVPAANAVPRNPEQNAAQPANPVPVGGELEPAQAAARLLEQRRQADGSWIMTQMRRIEHAALLFLASLVPGVGERHIAAREAEANAAEAERQRQAEAVNASENSDSGTAPNANTDAEAAEPEGNHGEGPIPAPEQPLVQV